MPAHCKTKVNTEKVIHLKPQTCPSCGAHEFIEKPDAYVCAYCDTQYPRTKPVTPPPAQPEQPPAAEASPVQKPIETPKSKWFALLLCYFFGVFGAHKFYEGNKKLGRIYLFTFGLFGVGWIADLFILLFKPNPYYV